MTASSRGGRALLAAGGAVAAAVCAASASAATVHCLAESVGPGSLRRGGDAGARCMLAEYRDHCHAADYVLSTFGVDTVRQETFRLVVRSRRCRVLVIETFRVVPQQPHLVGQRTCGRLLRLGSDVVADRCTGSAPSISLTALT